MKNPESINYYQDRQQIEKKSDLKKKIIASLSGIAFALSLGVVSSGCSSEKKIEAATEPTEQVEKAEKVPREAREFVETYGDRYDDPVSAYYVNKAYMETHDGKSLIMTDEYINNYKKPHQYNMEGKHGFAWHPLPNDIEINTNLSVKVFNEYAKPMMENYLNLVAMNPGSKAAEIIDDEFMVYCGVTTDNQEAEKLMTTLKNIVFYNGSGVEYHVAEAEIVDFHDEESELKKTAFIDDITSIGKVEYGEYSAVAWNENFVRLLIEIDRYDGKKITKTSDIIDDFIFSVSRVPNEPIISIGQD